MAKSLLKPRSIFTYYDPGTHQHVKTKKVLPVHTFIYSQTLQSPNSCKTTSEIVLEIPLRQAFRFQDHHMGKIGFKYLLIQHLYSCKDLKGISNKISN